jgi:hypothetical protein
MRVTYEDVNDLLSKKLTPPPTVGDGPSMAPEMLLNHLITLQEQCDQAVRDCEAAEEQRKCAEGALANVSERLAQCICGKRSIHEELEPEMAIGLLVPPSPLLRRASSSDLGSSARQGTCI